MIVEHQKPNLLLNMKIPWIKPVRYPGVRLRYLLAIPRVQLKTKYTKHRHKKTQIPNTLLAKLIILPELYTSNSPKIQNSIMVRTEHYFFENEQMSNTNK